jgi:cyclic pyranopterin phosphate synthase
MALDIFGRQIHYLRISVTDHCNLRCLYCMPEAMSFKPNAELMQDHEILRLVQLFARVGFDKFRLTGGEPTVRANIVRLVSEIRQVSGVRTLSMTTNGVLFSRLAKRLADAGLQRVNFSLDTLDAKKFKRLTRWGELKNVWEGIQAAEEAGLTPIKINVVVVRGYNEEDVADLARLTLERPWQVRFIEMMPFGGVTEFQQTQGVSAEEIRQRVEAEVGSLERANGDELDGEARVYRFSRALGTVGFIASVTRPFCASCARARLTADGRLRLCLLQEREVDLLSPMRAGAGDEDLRQILVGSIWNKPWGHRLLQGEVPLNRTMSQIGG